MTPSAGKPRLPEYVPGELLVKFTNRVPAINVSNAKQGRRQQADAEYAWPNYIHRKQAHARSRNGWIKRK